MGLTFYPIEDIVVLNRFRQQLCPFMKAIQKTTKIEYESSINTPDDHDEKESIFDEIIRTARSNQVNNQLSGEWFQFIRNPLNRTLESEHDNLIAANLE